MTRYNSILMAAFTAICLFAMQSCYKDKGNYNYHNIEELTVAITPPNPVRVGQTVTIHPSITSTDYTGNDDDYSYEWVRAAGVAGGANVAQLIFATTKDLVDFVPPFPSNATYKIYLEVKTKATGVKWISNQVDLVINQTEIGPGIFFMTKDASGVGSLYLVNLTTVNNKDFDLRRIQPNGLPALTNAIGVACYMDNNAPAIGTPAGYAMTVLTEGRGYRIHWSTLTYDPIKYPLENIIVSSRPAGFYISDINVACDRNIMGNEFFRDNNGNLMLYSPTGSYSVLPTIGQYANAYQATLQTFKASSFIANFSSSVYPDIIFNEDTKSFMKFTDKIAYSIPFGSSLETQFAYNNTNRELLFMHGRDIESGALCKAYALMKGLTDGKYYFLGFNANTGVQDPQQDVSSLPEIASTKQCAMTYGNRNNEFLYYRTDTKIHLYNISLKTNTPAVYSAPAGRQISYMRTIRDVRTGSSPFDDYLMVFTYDPTSPDTSGKLEVFTMQSLTGTLLPATYVDSNNATKNMIWDGFGKVVSADWKNK